jgi:methyl-accepting chemotaxis protein
MKNRRKQRFIDLAVQGALIRRILLHWFLFLATACMVLPVWRIVTGAEPLGPFTELMARGWVHSGPIFVILLAMLPVFVWDTVRFSQRFAGPMYRFHKTIQDINAGEESRRIKLREGDFWTQVADDFNVMMERMEQRDKGGLGDRCREPIST